MKFSILLPTRNRLELLRIAVQSVLEQEESDWEIIVSDNASDADIGAWVLSLKDSRVRYRRFPELVPVTDNWNAALDMAQGDYMIMLGDDDVLVPGGLLLLRDLLDKWNMPDAVYAQARQYAYPGVMPGHPDAFVQTGYNAFLMDKPDAFELPRPVATETALAAMHFRILYGFNMQHFAFSRTLVQRLSDKGPFFQSPYPDYYAANAILLTARVIASPQAFAMIGISPKSFGFYYFNERESDGVAFLKNIAEPDIVERLKHEIVPGNNMNDSWLCAMQTLARNFPDLVGGEVSYAKYRRLQYHEMLKAKRFRKIVSLMRWWEVPLYGAAALVYLGLRIVPGTFGPRAKMINAIFSPSPQFDPERRAVPFKDIGEAARGARKRCVIVVEHPLVSLCIPVFNAADVVGEALQSALDQTYIPLEILVLDNCSSDKTAEVVQAVAGTDPRVRYLRHSHNLGMAGNFNAALKEAAGTHVLILCSDDVMEPGSIAVMAQALFREPQASMVAGGRKLIDLQSQPIRVLRPRRRPTVVEGNALIRECFALGNRVGEPSAVMFRSEAAREGFNPAYNQLLDLEMWFRILAFGPGILLPQAVCKVRIHGGQATFGNIRSGRIVQDKQRLFRQFALDIRAKLSPLEKLCWDCRMASSLVKMRRANGAHPPSLNTDTDVTEVFYPSLFNRVLVPAATLLLRSAKT